MENIKKLRSKSGLTQLEFAKKIGVNRVTVIKWESDKIHWIPEKTALKLAKFFGVGVDELYGEDTIYRYLRVKPKTHEECEHAIAAIKGSEAWVS